MDGIEVWNSAWSPANERAVELWHTLLVGGNRIIGKTKCDGIQNQMRLFGGRVSPKRKATKISHTHTKKHRSNGF